MREKVFSGIVLLERIIVILSISLGVSFICVDVVEKFKADMPLLSIGLELALVFFLIGFGISELIRHRKRTLSYVYKRELKGKWKFKLKDVLYNLILSSWWIFYVTWMMRLWKPKGLDWLGVAAFVLIGIGWFLKACNVFIFEPKIMIVLSAQRLKLSYQTAENTSSKASDFSIDAIVNACVLTGEIPQQIRPYLTQEASGNFTTNEDENFFLNDSLPLGENQTVQLELKNGKRVFIETDDGENFIAALLKLTEERAAADTLG